MKKQFLLLILILNSYAVISQITITEVYYDTPFLEDIYHYDNIGEQLPTPFLHHMGEYIELYNYSSEDIPLKGWAITDNVSRYDFPNNAIIRANQFIVVAYRGYGQPDYFTSFFPTTAGKQAQIFYQDKIMLRNMGEELKLHAGDIRGLNCKNKVIQRVIWGVSTSGYNVLLDNTWYPETSSPNAFDFYLPSLHYLAGTTYAHATASPLEEEVVLPTQDLEDILMVQETLNDLLSDFTWDYYSDAVLANTCPDDINIVEQNPSENLFKHGKMLCL
ncbi:MAG: lamin tail domain-containing protein [Flavobacterium sp.]